MIKPVIQRYLGGKSRMLKTILRVVPDCERVVEPFCGSAIVAFNMTEPAVINDLNKGLMEFYKILQEDPALVMRTLFWEFHHRRLFHFWREMPESWERFLYLHCHCFGGRQIHPTFGYGKASFHLVYGRRIWEKIQPALPRLYEMRISCKDFEDCIRENDRPGAFFYVDPPYVGYGEYYEAAKFTIQDHIRLFDCLTSIKGMFLLSAKNESFYRDLYQDFDMMEASVLYTSGSIRGSKLSGELLIANYELRPLVGKKRKAL